jgi:transcriptional regulator of PTS gene
MRIGDQEYNRLKVLKTLRRAEPVGRTELAGLSGLTGGTITEICGDLVERGLLLEERMPSGRRGRPRVNLRINPAGGYALGAYLNDDGRVACEIVDLTGTQCFLYVRALPAQRWDRIEPFVAAIAGIIDQAIEASPFPRAMIERVGLGLPALIDSEGGAVHWLQTFEAGPVQVAAPIAEVLQLPVTIDNNINVVARGEHWFGDHAQSDDFLLLHVALGISSARYANGQLVSGAHGLNSELGHSKIVADGGLPCDCGASGCLGAYGSLTGIVRQIATARGEALPHFPQVPEIFRGYADEAERGNAAVQAVFERAGRYLGIAMANHINGFDPGRILMMVDEAALIPRIAPAFFAAVRANTLPAIRAMPVIEIRVLEDELYRQGLAAVVLEQIFRNVGRRVSNG